MKTIGETMSKQDNRENAKQKTAGNTPSNVVALPQRCPVDSCGKKPERSTFCMEHFNWFKFGLINRKGEKPKDFDKKYQSYKLKQDKQAA